MEWRSGSPKGPRSKQSSRRLPCRRSSRRSSAKAVVASTGAWSTTRRFRSALAAGARRVYVLLCGGVNSRPIDSGRPYEALLVAFGLSIRTRLRRDLATGPADVDVVVLEQSGVEEILWQDFSHTEELLERGYLDARVVLDRVERQMAERRGTRAATRWWSRTSGRAPSRKESRARTGRPED